MIVSSSLVKTDLMRSKDRGLPTVRLDCISYEVENVEVTNLKELTNVLVGPLSGDCARLMRKRVERQVKAPDRGRPSCG